MPSPRTPTRSLKRNGRVASASDDRRDGRAEQPVLTPLPRRRAGSRATRPRRARRASADHDRGGRRRGPAAGRGRARRRRAPRSPVAPASQTGRGQPSRPRIARPSSSEAIRISRVAGVDREHGSVSGLVRGRLDVDRVAVELGRAEVGEVAAGRGVGRALELEDAHRPVAQDLAAPPGPRASTAPPWCR